MMPTPTRGAVVDDASESVQEIAQDITSELTSEVSLPEKANTQTTNTQATNTQATNTGNTDEATRLRAEEKAKIINRLRRLEGQVRGLQRMVEEERSCQEVLTLLSGVRSALNATADRVLVNYLEHCQLDIERGETDMQDLVKAVKLARG